MKSLILILAILLVTSIISNAQETKKLSLSEITISSGKTALTSGLDTRVTFTNGSNLVLFIQANNDRAYINIGRKIKKFQITATIGPYKNVPWAGPMIVYQKGIFDAIVWNGVSLATDPQMSKPGYKPTFFFSYEGVGLTFLKTNRIGGAVQWFQDQKLNWFVSYKKIFKLGEKSKLFGEITYNHSLDIPMFVMGYSLKLN
ncbi:hypothetical protein HXX01_02375 [Candidatus Nomurabacteria bacterium]|nr:hypothetical protein [Candidatus Nomurabacteria bacterium]